MSRKFAREKYGQKSLFMSPKVSVVMAVYNGERHLAAAIDSILQQSLTDLELIIINDASTDNSVQIINSYGDERIRLVHNSDNIGLTKSLNKGLSLANGQYIARLDADDISVRQRLEKQVAFLDKHRSVGLCGTWARIIGEREGDWCYPTTDEKIRSWFILENVLIHSSVVMRKAVLDRHELQYNEYFQYSQDYELWFNIARHCSLANIGEILVYHRIHSRSIGAAHKSLQYQSADKVRHMILTNLGLRPNQREIMLHHQLATWQFQCQLDFVNNAQCWLLKVCQANEKMGIFPEPAFSEVIAERWYRVCQAANRLGPTLLQIFWRSSLSKHHSLSLKNKLGFAGKCIFGMAE